MAMKKICTLLAGLLILVMAHAQLDTAGLSTWQPMYNSMTTWDEGAFNMNALGHPDYGWGLYNSQNHNVYGDSLYVIKCLDGEYRDLYLDMKYSMQNYYIFRYTGVDGGNEVFEKAPCYDYTNKLFLYYSFGEGRFVDREPDKSDWDIVLTKYHDNVIDYDVTGLLLNETTTACYYYAPDSASAWDATLADTTDFSDSLTIIGNSWYELQGMSILPLDSVTYFIKTAGGEIFRLNVSYFESGFSGQGRVGIHYRKLYPEEGEAMNDTLVMGSMYANDVYYGLSASTAYQADRSNWDIAFKTNAFSASVLANTTMGVELYTWPKGDATAWITYSTEGKQAGDPDLIAYPNPVRDMVYLRSDKFVDGPELHIRVVDISGREVMQTQKAASEIIILNLHSLDPGTYFVTVSRTGLTGMARIIKAE